MKLFKKRKNETNSIHKFEEETQKGCEKCSSKMVLWGIRKEVNGSESSIYACSICGAMETFVSGKRRLDNPNKYIK